MKSGSLKMVHWIFSDFANASPLTTLPLISQMAQIFYSDAIMYSMNALEICVISVISVRKNILRGYFHEDFTDLADFLFRCYYV